MPARRVAVSETSIPALQPLPLNPRLYEINTRVWLRENGWDSPADIPDAVLDDWGSQFDIIWLMGVWVPSDKGREVARAHEGLVEEIRQALPDVTAADIVSSPYSIRDYRVSPLLGGDRALESFRARLHHRGLRLILDLVPNHMAIDHPWVTAHPDRFVQGTTEDISRSPQNFFRLQSKTNVRIFAHGKDPYFDGWQDTVQIDIFNPKMRRAMIELLIGLAGVCDGVRCDMAMLLLNDVFKRTWNTHVVEPPPVEFWKEAVAAVKMHRPDFMFLAEVYWDLEGCLQELGFDYTYDKKLYDSLRECAVDPVRRHLKSPLEFQSRSARMIENHDEKRAANVFEGLRHQAAAMITYSVSGLRFFHEGQMDGRRVKIPVQLARRVQEPQDDGVSLFYIRLLTELAEDVLLNGKWQMLDPSPAWADNASHEKMFGFWWQKNDDLRLVVVNYAPHPSQCYFRLPASRSFSGPTRFADRLSARVYDRDADDVRSRGMYFDMSAWDAHLFRVEPISR